MASKRKLIKWYKDKQGLITYSRQDRQGPHSYDSAGAMFSALIYADYLPGHTWIGDMSLLRHLEGSLLHLIHFSQIRRGDVFIAQAKNLQEEGYTGVVIDQKRMIYCGQDYDGIVISKFKRWPNYQVNWYRLAEPVCKRESFLEKLEQWLNRYNRRRTLQAVDMGDLYKAICLYNQDLGNKEITE